MDTPYTAVADEWAKKAGVAPPPVPEDAGIQFRAVADAWAADKAAERQAQIGAALRNAAPPDAAAKALQLSRQTGIPNDVVQRNLTDVERDERARQMLAGTADSPVLARKLADQGFMSVAQDDTDTLSSIEKTIAGVADLLAQFPRSIAGALGPGVGAALYGLAAAPVGAAEQIGGAVVQGLDNIAAWVTGTGKRDINADEGSLEGVLLEGRRRALGEQRSWVGDLSRFSRDEQSILGGIESTGQQLPALLLGLAGAPAKLTLGLLGAMTAGQSYGKARDADAGPLRSLSLALPDATWEVLGEKWLGMMGLLGDLKAGMPLLKVIGRDLVRENLGEIPTTLMQNLDEWAVLNPGKTAAEWLDEQPDAIRQTVIATTTQTLLMGGSGHVVNRMIDKQAAARWEAAQAEEGARRAEVLHKLFSASKVMERDATTAQEFIAQVAGEDGEAPTQFFVDASQMTQALNQSALSMDEFAAMAPKTAAGLAAALAGEAVAMPMSEYAAMSKGAPDTAASLIDHVRVDEQAPTRAESRVILEELGAELQGAVEREMGRSERGDVLRAQVADLRQVFQQELDAVGRFSQDANGAYADALANYYGATASRLGMTPAELLDRYRMRVASRADGGGTRPDADAVRQSAVGRNAPRVTQDAQDGAPVFFGDDITIAFPQDTERLEVIPADGERVVNYAIMAPDGFDVLGYVELLIKGGQAVSLLDIEVNPSGRRQGAGRKVIEALLAANPDADLNISNIVQDARGFWAKMGVPEQNLEQGAAYEGTLNWRTYAQAQDDGRADGAAPVGAGASPGSGAGEEGGSRSPEGEASRALIDLRKREAVLKRLAECL
jgi:GNAT superfamily N-acetyltransferase